MNTQYKRKKPVPKKHAATIARNLRTFLLVSQFEAEAIGARIAQARKEAGMTQEELAALASFSKRSLQDYEAGITIPYRHLQELGTLLRKPVDYFLHGEPERIETDRLKNLEDQMAEANSRLRRLEELLRDAHAQTSTVAIEHDDPGGHDVPNTNQREALS
jgi:transcriptional regulator with XRE-family HTH domain